MIIIMVDQQVKQFYSLEKNLEFMPIPALTDQDILSMVGIQKQVVVQKLLQTQRYQMLQG